MIELESLHRMCWNKKWVEYKYPQDGVESQEAATCSEAHWDVVWQLNSRRLSQSMKQHPNSAVVVREESEKEKERENLSVCQ